MLRIFPLIFSALHMLPLSECETALDAIIYQQVINLCMRFALLSEIIKLNIHIIYIDFSCFAQFIHWSLLIFDYQLTEIEI